MPVPVQAVSAVRWRDTRSDSGVVEKLKFGGTEREQVRNRTAAWFRGGHPALRIHSDAFGSISAAAPG